MTDQAMMHPSAKAEPVLTISYILRQMEKIQQDNAHVLKAIEDLAAMPSNGSPACGAPPDLQGQAKAKAIAKVALEREKTNQKLLSMYTMMYTDLVHPDSDTNI